MRQSAYKGILNFLIKVHGGNVKGQSMKRLMQLTAMVTCCMKAKRCTQEGLSQTSRSGRSDNKESMIKQTKRFLANKWVDWELNYLPFASHFLESAAVKGELTFIVDGSQVGSSNTCLMISVLWNGHAFPVVWVVKKGKKGHFPENMHLDLLNLLRTILPKNCRFVLLGDGEFDGKRLRALCDEAGFEYVLRTSTDRQVNDGVENCRFDQIAPPEGHEVWFLASATESSNGVVWHGAGHENPIYLLTNLDLGEMACEYYKRRFKIESMFKLFKSRGFLLDKTQITCPERISRLIIVAALAFCFSYCLGCNIIQKCSKDELDRIVRRSKLKTVGMIYLAQRCIEQHQSIALRFLSNFSKNFDYVFT
jgi:Transposase DDE domain